MQHYFTLMKDQERASNYIRLGWLRMSMLILTGLVGVLWISSYFVGIQRSDWSSSGATTSERAQWLVSNYGSFGFGWRSQDGELGNRIPPGEHKLTVFESSSSALNHVHPEGFLAWHWIHHERTRTTMMGLMRTGCGHLYLPYWLPFVGIGSLAFSLSVCIRRRANEALEKNSHPASRLDVEREFEQAPGVVSSVPVGGR